MRINPCATTDVTSAMPASRQWRFHLDERLARALALGHQRWYPDTLAAACHSVATTTNTKLLIRAPTRGKMIHQVSCCELLLELCEYATIQEHYSAFSALTH